MHALSEAHSELETHSGRQFGGAPIYSRWQVHFAVPLDETAHCELGPQGEG